MTLIARHHSQFYGSRSLSDCLTSLPGNTGGTIHLPFRPEPIPADVGDRSMLRLAQKTVIFGKTRILWANSKLYSEMAIKAIFDESETGTNVLSKERALEIFQEAGVELENVSLIYSYIDCDHNSEWSIDCIDVGPNLIASGSGEYDFFQNIILPNHNNPADENEVFENLTAATVIKSCREMFEPDYDFLYGGWFEQTGIRDWQFEKMPMALKVWPFADGQISCRGPLFFSQYYDHHLAIYIIKMNQTPQGLIPNIRSILVDDMLGRTAPPADPYGMQFAPEYIVHIFVRTDANGEVAETSVHTEQFQPGQGFEVTSYTGEQGQPRVGVDISNAYAERMVGLANFGAPEAFGAPFTGGHAPDDWGFDQD